ncbi:alpha/beta hydrolase [Portibacter lacus]|nr:alpha/beta hydrolase-fold protein [Portibacter lacus]
MSSFKTVELSEKTYESGNLRFLTVKSPNLKGRGDICLFVPSSNQELRDLPIYILLHGVYGSSWAWAMKGGAAQSAQTMIEANQIKPAIIAMPSDGLWGDGSAYLPHHQKNFEEWIVSDVPTAVRENIPEASDASVLCIGGLSMGGYGALMLGAKHGEKFKAASGHSSITKLMELKDFVEEPIDDYKTEGVLYDVIDAMKFHHDKLPKIRFDCGISDSLLDANRKLHQEMDTAGIKHIYEEFDGGHEWPYWQDHVTKTFMFFDKATNLDC